MSEIELTVEQEAEQIEDILQATVLAETQQRARLLASKENRQLLGQTELRIRDVMHRLGAVAIDAALSEWNFVTPFARARIRDSIREGAKRGDRGSSNVFPHCQCDA